MASPAQVANDMAAHAAYWRKRDKQVERACLDAARVIRTMIAGQPVDGRTYGGLWRRLLHLAGREFKGYPDFARARATLERLDQERRRGQDD